MDDLRAKLNDFASDVFKDLRDRRMLLPVILLVVAIVAVPLLVGGGGEEPPAPTPITDADPEGAEELDAVVLTGDQGVRDFHERVDGRPRNPFKQQYPGLKKASSDAGADEGSTDPSGSAGTGTDPAAGSGAVDGSTAAPGSVPSAPGAPASPDAPQEPKRVTKLIRMTVDVRISHSGKKRDIEDIEPLTLVPGERSPITQYTGASRDGKQASFVVSSAVSMTEGDGNCMPGRKDCQFLVLEPGESQYLHYGPKAKRYRLKLLAINRVVEKVKEDESGSKAGSGERRGGSGATAEEVG